MSAGLLSFRPTPPAAHGELTYIHCTVGYDPTTGEIQRREDARIRSEPAWGYRELEASYAAPLTAPRAVADLLVEFG